MINIVVGGQMDKQSIARLCEKCGGDEISVVIKSDIEASMAIKSGKADYYIGACSTGAGGALAMANALIGSQHCCSLSIPGKINSPEQIIAQVENGKKAFGFVNYDAERIVPVLIAELIKKSKE